MDLTYGQDLTMSAGKATPDLEMTEGAQICIPTYLLVNEYDLPAIPMFLPFKLG